MIMHFGVGLRFALHSVLHPHASLVPESLAGIDKHGLLAYPELTRIYYIQSIEEHMECAFEPFKGVGFICSYFRFVLSVRPFPSIQGLVAA